MVKIILDEETKREIDEIRKRFERDRIVLYEEKGPRLNISMNMYFNEKGQLVFDGCDSGEFVKETMGDWDYEYSFTIEPDGVEKLYSLFELPNTDRALFLAEMKKRFGGIEADSKIRAFLEENKIDFETFYWR